MKFSLAVSFLSAAFAGVSADHPVDGFVDSKIRAAEIPRADIADPRTLIRRASLDLTGLPPTPGQIHAFTKAYEKSSAEAWEALIDRLLGVLGRCVEQIGRHEAAFRRPVGVTRREVTPIRCGDVDHR